MTYNAPATSVFRILITISCIFFTFVSRSVNCQAEINRDDLAAKYHGIAINLVQLTKSFESSLAYFRAACRAKPEHAVYLNDLAVTEMRLKYYQHAKRRLTKALSVGFELASKNLEQLRLIMGESDDFNVTKDLSSFSYLQSTRAISRVSLKALKKLMTSSRAAHGDDRPWLNEPVIVRNAAARLGINIGALSVEQLAASSKYSHEDVDFFPHNILSERSHALYDTLGNAVRQMLSIPDHVYANVDASEPGTYVIWNIGREDILNNISRDTNITNLQSTLSTLMGGAYDWVEEILGDDSQMTAREKSQAWTFIHNIQWFMFNMGEKNSGTYLHSDSLFAPILYFQTQGKTKWHLCPESQSTYLHANEAWIGGELDAFNPNYKRFPKFKDASCFQDTLSTGDMLIVPPLYWRQTVNLETPTGFLSFVLVELGSYEKMIRAIKARVCDTTRNVNEHESCMILEKVSRMWAQRFITQHFDDEEAMAKREGIRVKDGERDEKEAEMQDNMQRSLDQMFIENSLTKKFYANEEVPTSFSVEIFEEPNDEDLVDFEDVYLF